MFAYNKDRTLAKYEAVNSKWESTVIFIVVYKDK